MMMRKLTIAAALACMASGALADDTKGFVGLNYVFGARSSGFEGVLGAMRYDIDADGDTNGAKLSLHLGFGQGPVTGKIKLTGLTGNDDVMGELGMGYGSQGFFGTGGLWGQHWNVGGDLYFNGDWSGYVGLHSLELDRPASVSPVITEPDGEETGGDDSPNGSFGDDEGPV
ncbi:hypothetical protein [Thioclava indica]|uniref:Porin domain-containing protein n=1 Tax=Thioclava indica TaxID=1353528 RepID=A0A074JIP1_9RHOB|nr:hypothetical protein [Thioclava indica]KEO57486.1 hypothetical protein DT23_05285 [Thioclava indica]